MFPQRKIMRRAVYLGDAGFLGRRVEKWYRKEEAANDMHAIKPVSVLGESDRTWCKTHNPESFYPGGEEALVFKYQILSIIGCRLILGGNFPALTASHKRTSGADLHSFGKSPFNQQLEVGKKITNMIRSEENVFCTRQELYNLPFTIWFLIHLGLIWVFVSYLEPMILRVFVFFPSFLSFSNHLLQINKISTDTVKY